MVQVQIGNTLKRGTFNFTHDTTIREIIESKYEEVTGESLNVGSCIVQLDYSPLATGEVNKSLAELGYDGTEGHNRCKVTCVIKAQNA